jgi:hypothetical protein
MLTHIKGGESMSTEVRCTVSNCTYWAAENRCAADAILVEIDQHTKNYKLEIGEIGVPEHSDHAVNSSMTCCHTFKPKK